MFRAEENKRNQAVFIAGLEENAKDMNVDMDT